MAGARGRLRHRLLAAGELPQRDIHRILVLRPNHRLGNTLLLTPLLVELGRRFPGAEIDVLTACEAADKVFAGFRQIRRIYQLTSRPGHHPLHALAIFLAMRRHHYDLCIDSARGSRSGRLLLRWSGARYLLGLPHGERERREVGEGWRRALAKAPVHFALTGVHALRTALGVPAEGEPYPVLRLHLDAAEREAGRTLLADLLGPAAAGRRIVALFPNATGKKRLSEAWWLGLIEALAARRPDLLFVEMIAGHGHSQLGARFPSYYSGDIRKLAAVLSQCAAHLSGDCGVMHLASAAGVPTLGLFVKGNLERYRPYGPHDAALAVAERTPAQVAEAALPFFDALPR
ncbi:glycosyltransferase family 9 protein [Frateuria defendens]|uniref:glycosyltransferase family 9 protein n=1 Tax=Frateuria defendens TaxID=2219559 RepID=UPI00066FC03D|nr:glycosyltransferase family 9 protein [Frateuria defendens]